MPAACATPEFHPWLAPGPGTASPTIRGAVSGLWLAVAFQVALASSSTGTDAVSSGNVQLVRRAVVAARTRATSAGVTAGALLLKLART